MDFKEYSESLESHLLNDGFHKMGQYFSDNVVCCAKILPPVFYTVCIINLDEISPEYYERNTSGFLKRIKDISNESMCTKVIRLNIFVSSNGCDKYNDFCKNKYIDTSSDTHDIWWLCDISNKKLISNSEQPSKLIGIEKTIYKAFNGEAKLDYNIPETKRPIAVYIIMAINIAVWAYILLSGNNNIIYVLASGKEALSVNGLYRLVTSFFTHAEIEHLAFNMLSLYIFGGELEKIMSNKNFCLIYFSTGIFSSVISSAFNGNYSIGASGAVYGLVGALLCTSLLKKRIVVIMDYVTLILYAVISILLGFGMSGIDNYAHVSGFLSGFVIQYILLKFKKDFNKCD